MISKTKLNVLIIMCFALVCFVSLGFIPTIVKAESSAFTGEGTKESPYLIEDIEDFKTLAQEVNDGNSYDNKYLKLTSDIDLSGQDWTPIGTGSAPFCGMFDGDNHTIKNLKINWSKAYGTAEAKHYAGLFGHMKGGADSGIKNITVENADVTACLYVGVILGKSYTGGIIENCHVKGDIRVDAYSYAGIIVGRHDYSSGLNVNGDNVAIYNCSVEGIDKMATVNCDYAVSYAGAIVGFLAEGNYMLEDVTVKNVEVKGTYGLGGISGIGHYGNSFKNVSVEKVNVISINNNPESSRSGNVGIVVGACQGTDTSKTVFKGYEIRESYAEVNGEEFKSVFGSSIENAKPVTNFVVKVNDYDYYETLAEASATVKAGDQIVLVAETTETVELPAGVKFNTNGFDAKNITVEPLQIGDIKVERNAEDNATIVTITYLNCDKDTVIVIPDGKDGQDGQDGIDGIDGIDGKDGIDGQDGQDGKDGQNGLNGTNGKDGVDGKDGLDGKDGKDGVDGKNGKDANNTLAIVGTVTGGVALIGYAVLVIVLFKKKNS